MYYPGDYDSDSELDNDHIVQFRHAFTQDQVRALLVLRATLDWVATSPLECRDLPVARYTIADFNSALRAASSRSKLLESLRPVFEFYLPKMSIVPEGFFSLDLGPSSVISILASKSGLPDSSTTDAFDYSARRLIYCRNALVDGGQFNKQGSLTRSGAEASAATPGTPGSLRRGFSADSGLVGHPSISRASFDSSIPRTPVVRVVMSRTSAGASPAGASPLASSAKKLFPSPAKLANERKPLMVDHAAVSQPQKSWLSSLCCCFWTTSSQSSASSVHEAFHSRAMR